MTPSAVLLYEDYVWVSLGNAMKAKQSKQAQGTGRRSATSLLAIRVCQCNHTHQRKTTQLDTLLQR
jgi:hypothetical protein